MYSQCLMLIYKYCIYWFNFFPRCSANFSSILYLVVYYKIQSLQIIGKLTRKGGGVESTLGESRVEPPFPLPRKMCYRVRGSLRVTLYFRVYFQRKIPLKSQFIFRGNLEGGLLCKTTRKNNHNRILNRYIAPLPLTFFESSSEQ